MLKIAMKQKVIIMQEIERMKSLERWQAGMDENLECHTFLNSGQIQKALISGKKALEHFSEAAALNDTLNSDSKYKEWLSLVYYNLGIASQTHVEQGLQYHYQAYKLNPKDQDVIYQIWYNNNMLGNYKASVKAARKLESPMKELLVIYTRLLKETIKPEDAILEIKKFADSPKSPEEQYWFFDVSYYASYETGDYETALAICKSELEKTKGKVNILKCLVSRIVCMYSTMKEFEEGLRFFEQAKIDYPEILNFESNLIETYREFLLYEHTGDRNKSTELLKTLDDKRNKAGSIGKDVADHANQIRFFNELTDRNFEAAKIRLKKTSLNENFYLELIASQEQPVLSDSTGPLSTDDEGLAIAVLASREAVANSESEEAAETEVSSEGSEEKAVRFVLNSPSPAVQKEEKPQLKKANVVKPWKNTRGAEAFINYKKAVVKQKVVKESNSHYKEEFSWKLNDKVISTKDKYVYKVGNSENYYVYLPDRICTLEQRGLFEKAIEKGFVSRAFGQAGIKYCRGDGLAEVKIIQKSCVWTDLTLCNDKGKHILIIKHGGTHDAFKLVAPTGKMEVRNVETYNPAVKHDLKTKQHSKKTEAYFESKENKEADDGDEAAEAPEKALIGNQPMSPDSSVEPAGNIVDDLD